MSFKKFKRTTTFADEPVIAISDKRFQYFAVFSKVAELKQYEYVRYFVDEDWRRIGFEFTTLDPGPDAYSLSAKKNANNYRSSAQEIISRYSWVDAVASLPSTKDRWFVAKKEKNLWVITLSPAFENRVYRSSACDVPGDVSGIYRYIAEDGDVVYIGKGNIRARLSEPGRVDWNFDWIEYSEVRGEDQQYEWESFWIERYRERHNGFLPYYNKVRGISTKRAI